MATDTRYFTDKLAPETRIIIYGFLFDCDGFSQYIKRPAADDQQMSTSIFAVSKDVSREALETFYNEKTVRLRTAELDEALGSSISDFLRRVQIIDGIHTTPNVLQSVLERSLALPRIRTVTIASDCLMYGNCKVRPPGILQHANMAEDEDEMEHGYALNEAYEKEVAKPDVKPFITVREFAGMMGLGKATCTDIGRYKLDGKYAKVEVLHTKLLRMWPKVAATPENFGDWTTGVALSEEWDLYPENHMTIVSQTSLQLWVSMFESAAQLWPEQYSQLPYSLSSSIEYFMASIKGIHKLMVTTEKQTKPMELHKLTSQSDTQSLERATEFLALNVGTCSFAVENADERMWEDVRPYWCELEGGKPLGLMLHEKHVEYERQSFKKIQEFMGMRGMS